MTTLLSPAAASAAMGKSPRPPASPKALRKPGGGVTKSAIRYMASGGRAHDPDGQMEEGRANSKGSGTSAADKPVSENNALGEYGLRRRSSSKEAPLATTLRERLSSCAAVKALEAGEFDSLQLADIEDVFKLIDSNDNGELEFQEVRMFLKEVLTPPCTDFEVSVIYNHAAEQAGEDGLISPSCFLDALTSDIVKHHLRQLQREWNVKQAFVQSQGYNAHVDRDLLVERTAWMVSRDDAFRTLPHTLFTTIIFLALVVHHLNIRERHLLEDTVEAWFNGYGHDLPGPYLPDHVADTQQMYDWLNYSGLNAVFGNCMDNLKGGVTCHLAGRSVLVGDALLQQEHHSGSPRGSWLLQNAKAAILRPADALSIARQNLGELRESNWVDIDTDMMELVFTTYCARLRMFTITAVRIDVDVSGWLVDSVRSNAVSHEPYPDRSWLLIDALYTLLVCVSLFFESREIFWSIRLAGCWDGFGNYWGFWNAVDWIHVLSGMLTMCFWGKCCWHMYKGSFHDAIEDPDDVTLQANLDISKLARMNDDLRLTIDSFVILQFLMFFTCLTIMMKFFKAFQANPKLQVVTNTLKAAAGDIFHFGVVFGAIFITFAISGHILFGGSVTQFSTFARSVNSAGVALMGEFEWYAALVLSDVPLKSNTPRWLLVVWFWLFMVLVLLILMNMLLAIVLEHHSREHEKVDNEPDAQPLWEQGWQYIKRSQQTRGFLPMYDLLCQLLDDNPPAHEKERVSCKSLLEAFPKMKEEQAMWLLDWLYHEAQSRAKTLTGSQDSEEVARLKQLQWLVECHSEEMKLIRLNVQVCVDRLDELDTGAGFTKSKSKRSPSNQIQKSPSNRSNGLKSSELKAFPQGVTPDEVAGLSDPLSPLSPSNGESGHDLVTMLKKLTEESASQKKQMASLSGTVGELAQNVRDLRDMFDRSRPGSDSFQRPGKPVELAGCCGTGASGAMGPRATPQVTIRET